MGLACSVLALAEDLARCPDKLGETGHFLTRLPQTLHPQLWPQYTLTLDGRTHLLLFSSLSLSILHQLSPRHTRGI